MRARTTLAAAGVAAALAFTLPSPALANHDRCDDRRADFSSCQRYAKKMHDSLAKIRRLDAMGRHGQAYRRHQQKYAEARRNLAECRRDVAYDRRRGYDPARYDPYARGGYDPNYDPYRNDRYDDRYDPYRPSRYDDDFDFGRDWPHLLGVFLNAQAR